jgi:hypothetical protein
MPTGHFTLRKAIVKASDRNIKQWPAQLAAALLADCIMISNMIGYSPFQLLQAGKPEPLAWSLWLPRALASGGGSRHNIRNLRRSVSPKLRHFASFSMTFHVLSRGSRKWWCSPFQLLLALRTRRECQQGASVPDAAIRNGRKSRSSPHMHPRGSRKWRHHCCNI